MYKWLSGTDPVGLEGDLQMSQFDLQKTFARELNFTRSESVGAFSVLQVVFLLQRHTGYFLIQVEPGASLLGKPSFNFSQLLSGTFWTQVSFSEILR